jgi:trigger factor
LGLIAAKAILTAGFITGFVIQLLFMTVTEEKTNKLLSKLNVTLKKEDYEPHVKRQLKTLTKKVSIKGFRQGMVPVEMVKKLYGNSVLLEELNSLLNDEVQKYITDNKIEIILSPIPLADQKLDIDIHSIRDIEFCYEMALAPEIDLSFINKGTAFTKYKLKVDHGMLNDEIEQIRKRFASHEYPDTVGVTDVLTFTVEEMNADGTLRDGGQTTVTTLTVDLLKDEVKEKILLLKKQDSFDYNVFELMDREREAIAKNVLNMNDLSKLDEVGDKFKLTLNNITRSVPAVINEEFFTKVYGESGPRSEEEMRNNIKGDLDAYFDGNTDRLLINEIYKAIRERADFPLPDEFLKRWIIATDEEKSITDEQVDREYPQFVKSLRWQLLQRKIVKEEGFEVTNEEVTGRVRANLIQQLYGYGLKNIGEQWVEQFVQKQLTDKKVITETRQQLMEDKVLNFIKSKVVLEEKEVTLEEFQELARLAQAS